MRRSQAEQNQSVDSLKYDDPELEAEGEFPEDDMGDSSNKRLHDQMATLTYEYVWYHFKIYLLLNVFIFHFLYK